MTKPKGTDDLVDEIKAAATQNPATAEPAGRLPMQHEMRVPIEFAQIGPSDADWARFRQVLDDGDVPALRRLAADFDIPHKVLPTLLRVRDAYRTAVATVAAGKGAPAEVARRRDEIQALTASRPSTADDAAGIATRLAAARVELRAAEARFRDANYANGGARALREGFPQLISDLLVVALDGDSSTGGALYTVLGDMAGSGFSDWDSAKVSWLDHCRKPPDRPRRRARLIAR